MFYKGFFYRDLLQLPIGPAHRGLTVMEPFVLNQSSSAKSVSLWRTIKEAADIDGLIQDAAQGAAYLKSL